MDPKDIRTELHKIVEAPAGDPVAKSKAEDILEFVQTLLKNDTFLSFIPTSVKGYVALALVVISALLSGGLIGRLMNPSEPTPHVTPVNPPGPLPAKIAARGGELVVIDAGASKGDVVFGWDKKAFGSKQSLVVGKCLILVAPMQKASTNYTVTVISWDDKTQADVTLTVQGTDEPGPPVDPDASPIDKLNAKVDALTKAVNDGNMAQQAENAAMKARLTALEQIKPIPPPTPADAFEKVIQAAYEADGKPQAKMSLLAAVYRNSGTITNNQSLQTDSDVQAKMHGAVIVLIDDKQDLQNVRKAIQAEMKTKLGTNIQALTPQRRADIDAQFTRVAAALNNVK